MNDDALNLRFAWVPFEAGAPMLDLLTPFGLPDPLADPARIPANTGPGGPIPMPHDASTPPR